MSDQATDNGQIDLALTAVLQAVAVRDASEAVVASDNVDDEEEKEKRLNVLADTGYYSDDNVVACGKEKFNV